MSNRCNHHKSIASCTHQTYVTEFRVLSVQSTQTTHKFKQSNQLNRSQMTSKNNIQSIEKWNIIIFGILARFPWLRFYGGDFLVEQWNRKCVNCPYKSHSDPFMLFGRWNGWTSVCVCVCVHAELVNQFIALCHALTHPHLKYTKLNWQIHYLLPIDSIYNNISILHHHTFIGNLCAIALSPAPAEPFDFGILLRNEN